MIVTVYFAGVCVIMLKIKTGLAPVVEKLDLVLSIGEKKNHYPVDNTRETSCAIKWKEIYLVDSTIHLLNSFNCWDLKG